MSKYKRYERYKDSGIEWIGEIPEHWGIIKLKFLSTIFKGKNPKELTDEWREEILPYLSMEYLRNSGDTLTLYAYPEKNLVTVNNGDILILWDGSNAGEILEGKNGILSSTMAKIVPNNIVTRYLYWFLKGIEKFFKGNTVGMGIPHVNGEILKNHLVLLPNLEEQNSIANFLDQKTAEIDSLIADKKKLIELLQEKRQAIITEAVTKGLNPNVKMKDSGIEWIGEIPAHWRLSKIKYESLINNKTLSESTDDDYEIDYIDISSVTSIGEIDGVQSLNFKDAPSRARRILSKGDTIVSTVRTYLKAIAFIENAQSNLICSTGFAVLTPLSKVVPKYLFYLMRSEKYVNEIVRRSVGVSYPAVNASDIGALECALPDRDEQMYIVEYLDNCTTQINQLVNDIQAQIQKLKEYRQSLISEIVTGKIDVREFADKVEVI